MAVGRSVHRDGHIGGFKADIARARAESPDAFASWFNSDKDEELSFVNGQWDFCYHIASSLTPYINSPQTKHALEIGCGAGRLLAAASRYFAKVSGTDIHDCLDYVANRLQIRGIDNVSLRQTDGKHIPFLDSSFDVVYSFIVLQHVERIYILEEYIRETLRVLASGGIAVLYFGRYAPLSVNRSSAALVFVDKILERLMLPQGFKELTANVNETNLVVSRVRVERLVRASGGECLEWRVSRKNIPDGFCKFGGQHGLVFRKNY